MIRKNMFCQLMSELARTFNIEMPVSHGDNNYTISFAEDINVCLYLSEKNQLAHGMIQFLELREDQISNANFYQTLLRLQFLGLDTSDCFFGMGNNNKNIYLFKNFKLKEIYISDFIEQMTELVNVFKKCREQFALNDLPMATPARNIPNREFRMLV
ncbi:type III secretion system chaperone [Shewanella surugensis]|uniref:Type III secretion system chaperone n=1 Tax=Shewanella surugensis TaxID=212020 RepID=A0ABT0LE63_9GAMM|nr:type III secretion system chaperone [Shewanella surugensis]MCL1125945.1 type III secretion system chaperone [Shewanella surugensis]